MGRLTFTEIFFMWLFHGLLCANVKIWVYKVFGRSCVPKPSRAPSRFSTRNLLIRCKRNVIRLKSMQILEVLIFALGIGTLELSEFLIYQSQCDDKKFIFIYTDLRFKAKKVVMRVSFISSFSFFLILHARKAITRKKFLSPETNSHLCYYVCN